jgi:hypothetical protein
MEIKVPMQVEMCAYATGISVEIDPGNTDYDKRNIKKKCTPR